MKRIIIIGGGISGLAAAHRLIELGQEQKLQLHVTLLEASARLGGTIHTESRDGFLIERGPDSFISEKPEAVSLAQRLGLESRLVETNDQHRRSFIVRNGRLRPVPEGFQLLAPSRFWPFVTTDIFSFSGKLRMAADLFLPRKNTNGSDDESLASFVKRRLGKEALERMAQPMVGGIYTANPESLSLRATLPRFLEMERNHRSIILAMMRQEQKPKGTSGARYSLFLSFDRGMGVLVEALAKRIAACQLPLANFVKTEVRLNTRVEAIEQRTDGWNVRLANGETLEADALCLAVPSYVAASLLRNTSASLADKLDAIRYASTATINLGYKRSDIRNPLNGFGLVVPFVERRTLLACTFSSVKFSGRAPDDQVLLRAFVGGALQPDMFALAEDEMLKLVKADLGELLDIAGEPLFAEVAKWERSMPQYEVGHLERMKAIEQEVANLPRLALAGNAYRGAGIPDCVKSGESCAKELLNRVLR